MKRSAAALAAGAVFGLGLAIAGMTDPRKVLGFLDVAGDWDPSLLLVLGSAVVVAFVGYRLVQRQPAPLFDAQFRLPRNAHIDAPLVAGALLFGIGWGIAGYCPGPAIATLAYANRELLLFLPALLLGQWLHRLTRRG
ncbi:MAG: YeeE/YedE family protein [Pseudoxanthomonas sp.]